MTVDWNAVRDQAIRAYPYEIVTTEDAIKCSVFVQEVEEKEFARLMATDPGYRQTVLDHEQEGVRRTPILDEQHPIPHTKRITRTGEGFTDGACSGYLTYFDKYQGKLLLDSDIANLLREWLADEKYSDLFNAGYVVSFIEGLLEDRNLFAR